MGKKQEVMPLLVSKALLTGLENEYGQEMSNLLDLPSSHNYTGSWPVGRNEEWSAGSVGREEVQSFQLSPEYGYPFHPWPGW